MIEKVEEFIKLNNLLEKCDGIVVGVSGGADSICLLHILRRIQHKYQFNLVAVHIHHGIREESADEDARYVAEFCEKLDIEHHVYFINIKEKARELKVSEEEAGRIIRYEYFSKEVDKFNNGLIAVAHHLNDQAETVLHNFIRGTGLKGLGGMKPKRDKIIRPLLCVSRREIEDYLITNQIHFQIDETNSMDIYTRNKIRLNLIPYIEKSFNENIVSSINNTANILQQEEDYLNEVVNQAYKEVVSHEDNRYIIEIPKFQNFHISIRRRIVRKIMKHTVSSLKDISFTHIEDILCLCDKDSGKKLNLPRGIIVNKSYNKLIIKKGEKVIESYNYPIDSLPKDVIIKELNLLANLKLVDGNEPCEKNYYTNCFDYDKIEYTLSIRSRQPGDYIYLKGLKGKKKLKDFFIDIKVPREERDSKLLLADGSEIIWIFGKRTNERYRVTSSTKRILFISVSNLLYDMNEEENDERH